MICSYCNHENPDNFYFCGACGKPVRSAVSKLEPGFQTEPKKESRSQETPTSATDRAVLAAKDNVRGASLSTIDPELYPRREGEIPQPLRLPNGYRSSLLGLSPETDEPEYSYLLEDDRPSRWRFLTTAIILFLLGGLAYWQISLHGGVSGVVNAFRSRQQQDQQRRAEVLRPAAPADNTAADTNAATDSASASSSDQAPQPAQAAASTAKPSTEVAADNKPAQATPPQKRTASPSPASAPSPRTDSTATSKSASETTQQASLRNAETPTAAPSDDETTRLAEKYLYGQGVPQDCNRAVDLIKPAASSDNPKAQSMLGTMYATGHCVPRDLPTSYRYFALALHQQPRNQWVEKDMEMVWNQMSSSEKQLATRLAK